MTYQTIMLHMAFEQSNDARLRVAGELAERFGAAVIGIAACDHSPPPYYANGPVARDIVAQDLANLKAGLAELEARFRKEMQGRAQSIEWRCRLSRPTDYVAAQARAADLIIAGSRDAGTLYDPFRHVDVSALLMQAGRPVLVVPPATDWISFKTALVGWKDTREARRAVCDALPLLLKMQEVHVAEVPEDAQSVAIAARHVDDVVRWLKRHGVNAMPRSVAHSGNSTETLDTIATGVGADLLVAGAYGHSRFSEWVFGGVTRDLLVGGSRCSLLSH